jgi:radical SAM-linked protein
LRFLSHAETVRVFQRACARAGIRIQYSQGFNPHPKLSLPLPRSVGVESDDELLCLRVPPQLLAKQERGVSSELPLEVEELKAGLSEHLPEGIELLSVTIAQANMSPRPFAATYVLPVRQEYLDESLNAGIEHLLASESIKVQRTLDERHSRFKNIDVRGFIKSIVLKNESVVVECRITPAGAIRVEEILELLGLDMEKLAAPIRRADIQWQAAN